MNPVARKVGFGVGVIASMVLAASGVASLRSASAPSAGGLDAGPPSGISLPAFCRSAGPLPIGLVHLCAQLASKAAAEHVGPDGGGL